MVLLNDIEHLAQYASPCSAFRHGPISATGNGLSVVPVDCGIPGPVEGDHDRDGFLRIDEDLAEHDEQGRDGAERANKPKGDQA